MQVIEDDDDEDSGDDDDDEAAALALLGGDDEDEVAPPTSGSSSRRGQKRVNYAVDAATSEEEGTDVEQAPDHKKKVRQIDVGVGVVCFGLSVIFFWGCVFKF